MSSPLILVLLFSVAILCCQSVPMPMNFPAILFGDDKRNAKGEGAIEEGPIMFGEIGHQEEETGRKTSSCVIYENKALHVLMERICELCHDMYSHQLPNTRAECRADCFRGTEFKKCLRLFSPAPSRAQSKPPTMQYWDGSSSRMGWLLTPF